MWTWLYCHFLCPMTFRCKRWAPHDLAQAAQGYALSPTEESNLHTLMTAGLASRSLYHPNTANAVSNGACSPAMIQLKQIELHSDREGFSWIPLLILGIICWILEFWCANILSHLYTYVDMHITSWRRRATQLPNSEIPAWLLDTIYHRHHYNHRSHYSRMPRIV